MATESTETVLQTSTCATDLVWRDLLLLSINGRKLSSEYRVDTRYADGVICCIALRIG